MRRVFPRSSRHLAFEVPAYCLDVRSAIQKAVLFLGGGGTGKSTYLEACAHFLGKRCVSGITLQRLETNQFAASGLVGKLANICPDLPAKYIEDSSIFKAITGGDEIIAEFKFKDAFAFRPYAKLIFSANYAPRCADSSQAFYDRWLVIPMTRRVRGTKQEMRSRTPCFALAPTLA